jgi:hypothetical protein
VKWTQILSFSNWIFFMRNSTDFKEYRYFFHMYEMYFRT